MDRKIERSLGAGVGENQTYLQTGETSNDKVKVIQTLVDDTIVTYINPEAKNTGSTLQITITMAGETRTITAEGITVDSGKIIAYKGL